MSFDVNHYQILFGVENHVSLFFHLSHALLYVGVQHKIPNKYFEVCG